jgi:hypothetical protein
MIFISYSHNDLEFVEALHEALEMSRLYPWRDRDRIVAGNSFPQEIQRALRSCSAFIVVVSDSFEQSTWQGSELAEAISLGKRVIPIILGRQISAPLILSQFHQIRTCPGQDMGAREFMRVVKECRQSLGDVDELEDEFDDDSSGPDWDSCDDLESFLIGTRWSWRNGNDPRDLWIEFQSRGRVVRSWRPELGIWKALDNELIIFGPHLLVFDREAGTFKGAIPSSTHENPMRDGRLLD